MKSLTIPIIQNGVHIKCIVTFARSRRRTFDEIEIFIKENYGADAEIDNPEKFKKHLSNLNKRH